MEHHHHHSWRPHAIRGNNICPTCSISHFPFCPPHPHPSTYTAPPNLDHTRLPINNNMTRPIDPYYDSGCFNPNPNPNLPHVGSNNYVNVNGGYFGNDFYDNNVNVNDRSSKRLRVDDGVGGGDVNYNYSSSPLSKFPVEGDQRRVNVGFGYGGEMRGSAVESSGFDNRSGVGGHGQDPGMMSGFGMRPTSNVEMNNSVGTGRGVGHYRREELECGRGYGSEYNMKRSSLDMYDQQVAQYGQVVRLPDPMSLHQGGVGHDSDRYGHGYHYSNYGSSRGSNERFYDSNAPPVHYDPRGNMPAGNHYPSSHPPLPSVMHQQPGQVRYDYSSPHHFSDVRPSIEIRPPPVEGYSIPVGNQSVPAQSHYGRYGNSVSENMGHVHASPGFDVQPPLPASPPPPLPKEPPPVHWPAEHKPLSSLPGESPSLFPVRADSTAPVHPPHAPVVESHARETPHLLNSPMGHMAHGVYRGDPHGSLTSFGRYHGDDQNVPSKNKVPDKPKSIDAAQLFKPPHRTSRPDHFVIILRGLPGSGKSYLAKMLRDLEIENGGNAPRIHSMDDYFMTEVEKVEENEASKSSARVKKPTMKTVLEYCYEPEMEEAYRSSMLKAFKKTLEEGAFTFVIVDDRNLRVADFAQFWATAKRSGYEVYVLEAPYKDPAGCTARNVHGFTQVDIEKMAMQWEEAPSMYLQVDVKSLLHGDDWKESNIQEVDMDTEDGDVDGDLSNMDERGAEKNVSSSGGDLGPYVSPKDERNWDAEVGNPTEEVKDLGRSKWSDNLDDDEDERTEASRGKASVLPAKVRTYGREGKCVHWGDQGGQTGFSIGAAKKANMASLVIGPGAGYSLKSNPLPEDTTTRRSVETKKHNMFQEKLRAEQESFKAVFDRRRHRIGGLDAEDK